MNEAEMTKSAENFESKNIDYSIDEQSTNKCLNMDLSFFDIEDEIEERKTEISETNKENIELREEAEGMYRDRDENSTDKKWKPLSKKDRNKLDSDTQRIIRENVSEEAVAAFTYKPQQFKTFKELQEMLANNKSGNVDKRRPALCVTEPESTGGTEEPTGQTAESSSDIDVPLADRISRNCENNEATKSALAKLSSTARVLRKIDTVLKERYQSGGSQLIELKSREQLLADKRNVATFMQKVQRNMQQVTTTEPNTRVDFVIKEKQGKQVIEHRIVVDDTVKCVQLAGEIDPMLSKKAAVAQMLPGTEQQKLLAMSDRDKWKKHRSLLLAAEAEKRRPAVEARRKEMELLEGNLTKEGPTGGAAAGPNATGGLSDDDYEWKGDTDGGSGSDSGSVTDRGDASDCLSSDGQDQEEEDTFGKKIDRSKHKRAIIDSEDEASLDMTATAAADDGDMNRDSSGLLASLSTFLDIPSCEDLFSEPRSFVTTTSSSLDKSELLPTDYSLAVEQPGNRDWWIIRSMEATATDALCMSDNTVLGGSRAGSLDATVVMDRTQQLLDDTVVMDRTNQQLDDTVVMDRTQQLLDDTVVMDRTNQQLDDTVVMDRTNQQLDDTVVMDRTNQRLDDSVVMDRAQQRLEDTVFTFPTTNTNTKSRDINETYGETVESSLEMRLKHRKMFEFPSIDSSVVSTKEESLAKAAFSSLKELLAEQEEDDERDIDDVQLDDDDDGGVDLDRELSDQSVATVKEEEDSTDTDELSIDTDRKSGTDILDSTDDEVDLLEYEDDDEEELLRKRVAKAANPMDFVDDEAELSGSDAEQFGPDEDGSDLDRYEEDGDEGVEKLPSEGRMRRQIEKIHNRLEIDKDARDIRYLKEMYLEDGDLHIAGAGQRRRRYGWAGINDDDGKFGHYEVNGDGDDQDSICDDGANYDQAVLDQSNVAIVSDDENGDTESLREHYGKHLRSNKRVAKTLKTGNDSAWQNITNPALDIARSAGTIAVDDFVEPVRVVKKRGSLMDRVSQVPTNVSANSYQSMSLKCRMQQHTFTVQCRQNAVKRQSSNTDFNEDTDDINKKAKL